IRCCQRFPRRQSDKSSQCRRSASQRARPGQHFLQSSQDHRMSLAALTLDDAGKRLRQREFSSLELTEAVFQRIAATDDKIHAYLTVARDAAFEQARQADEWLKRDSGISPLLGIPITGKTNLDEFAMGSSVENSAFFPTRNPWNLERIPGGSSGGSAAAVASDQCIAALGTDTGGSIRQPAAFCGVVGLKPTYGRVSRYGIVAFASSMDQVGPMTKDVRDSALLLEAIAGPDPADSTSVNRSVPRYASTLTEGVKGLRLGIPKEYFVAGMQAEVERAVRTAILELEKSGAVIEEISLPHTEYAVAVYYIVATAEASSNLARYDGMRYGHRADAKDLIEAYRISRDEGFGAEVKRRIMLGTYALSAGYYDAYYLKAQKVRTLIKRDFDEAFKRCDVIVTPTAPTTAFKLGEKTQDPLQMYLSDIYTISINLAGLPALSLPCGFDSEGIPIGLQIIDKPFDESTIFRVAYNYEQATEWHKKRPRIGNQ